jgi:hypothetical protein
VNGAHYTQKKGEGQYDFGGFCWISHACSHERHTHDGGSQLRACTMTVVVEPQRGQGGQFVVFEDAAGTKRTPYHNFG